MAEMDSKSYLLTVLKFIFYMSMGPACSFLQYAEDIIKYNGVYNDLVFYRLFFPLVEREEAELH